MSKASVYDVDDNIHLTPGRFIVLLFLIAFIGAVIALFVKSLGTPFDIIYTKRIITKNGEMVVNIDYTKSVPSGCLYIEDIKCNDIFRCPNTPFLFCDMDRSVENNLDL